MTTPARADRTLVVNIPVVDLKRSKAFFTRLGFSYDPMSTDDETAASMLVGEQAPRTTASCTHAASSTSTATPGWSCGWIRRPAVGDLMNDSLVDMLTQVADGVWVRQSEWVWTNSIVVRGEDGLILVDPGIDGSELNQLADDLDRLGIPVVAGFSTHPHWDHLLWHPRFGDVPRYATAAGARFAHETREQQQEGAAEEGGTDIPLELIALVTPLPADSGPVPGEIIEHRAHAVGHAAVLLADRGVLLAGDMLSDVLIPLFDPRQSDQVGAYETALDRLGEAARHVDVVVPGHGAVAEGPEVAARVAADRAYIEALRRGEHPVDSRLEADWLSGAHQSNLEQARGR